MRRPLLALAALLVATFALWIVFGGDDTPLPRGPDSASTPTQPESTPAPTEAEEPRARVRAVPSVDVDDETPEEAEDEVPAFVLRVLTEDGQPVQGLAITVERADENQAFTDAAGRVAFHQIEWEQTAAPKVRFRAPDEQRLELVDGETVVRVPPTVPLDVRYVDAETGEPLDRGSLSSGPPIVMSGTMRAPLWPGNEFAFRIDPPAPMAALGEYDEPRPEELARTGKLSREATSARVIVPVFRTMAVSVRVVEADGSPAYAAHVGAGGVSAFTDEDGRATLSGIRYERRGWVRVSAELDGRADFVRINAPASADVIPDVVVELPPPPDDPVFEGPGVSGMIGTARSGRRGVRRSNPKDGTGSIVVRVLRRDGQAAVGARVGVSGPWRGGRDTDATGTAHFDGLPAGEYHVSARDVGLNRAREDIVLGEGETRRVVLTEPRGGTVRIEAVDAGGRPLACARITFHSGQLHEWVYVHEGVQHIDLVTDATGRLVLHHFPETTFRVKATYAHREGELHVREGEPARITVPD